MKIVAISDTHGFHRKLKNMPPADLLLHCGDFSNLGEYGIIEDFVLWMSQQRQYKYKIFIAGNHDLSFQKMPWFKAQMITDYCDETLIYLESQSVVLNINGEKWKIFGSPWTPEFNNWAFGMSTQKLATYWWDRIAHDTDIVITHGPPYGILDRNLEGNCCGCDAFRTEIEKVKPKLVFFGHIHESRGNNYGILRGTEFLNVSSVNRNVQLIHGPVEIEVNK